MSIRRGISSGTDVNAGPAMRRVGTAPCVTWNALCSLHQPGLPGSPSPVLHMGPTQPLFQNWIPLEQEANPAHVKLEEENS